MIDQKLELLSVSSTDKSAVFKVILNGEEKVFIGKVPKGYLFDSIPAVKTDSDVLNTFKFNSPMRTIDSFQKSYSIDKKVITDDDKKKDIIIPVVVSQDIVQLGNYMFSMSKMTNNTILYLLYKNRLVNRYVDDKTNITYYYLDDEFANKDSAEILAALRNENSPWSFTKFGDTENNLYAIEKKSLITSDNAELKANYKNLLGYTIFQDRQVVSEKEDEMPFSMLFEYDEDYQYTDEESQIFVNFLQLKNHLSPFFNVEVDKNNAFKAWRKFKKIANSNNTIWMTYNYETPRTLTTTTLTEDNPIIAESGVCDINGKFKNLAVQDYYSPFYYAYPSNTWAKNTSIPDKSSILGFMNEKSGYNKNLDNFENGFTLHTEFDTEQFKTRFLGFNHLKEKYEANNGSYMTAQEIASAFLESNSAFATPVYDENGNDISIQVYNDTTSKYYNPRVYYTIEVKTIDEIDGTNSLKGTNFTIKLIRDKTSSISTDTATIDLPYPIPRGTLGVGYIYADEITMSRNPALGNGEYWTNTKPASTTDSAFVTIDKGIDTVNGQIPTDTTSLPRLNTAGFQPRSFIINGVNNNNPVSKYFYDYDRKLYPTVISDTNPVGPSTFFKCISGSLYYNDIGISNLNSNGSAWCAPYQSNENYYANGNLYRIKMGFILPELENPNYIPNVLTAIYGNDTKKLLWDNLDPAVSPEDIETEFLNNCPTEKPADTASAARKIAYALYVIDTGISENVASPGNIIDISGNNIKVKIAPNSKLEELYNAGTNTVKTQLRNFNPTFTTKIRASKTYDEGKPTEKKISYKLVTKQDLVRGYLYYARKYNRWYTGDTITFKNLRIRCNTPAMFGISYFDHPEDFLYKNDNRYYNYLKNGVEHYNTLEDVNKAYPDKSKIAEGTIISIGYGDKRNIQYLGGQDYYGWLYRFTKGEWQQILDSSGYTIIRNSQPDIRSFSRVFSLMKARKPITTNSAYNNYWSYKFSSVSGTQYDMVIDLFGSVIGNKFISGQSDSNEIINAIKQSSDKTTFVDLAVSFKDSTGQDTLSINVYINGRAIYSKPISFDKNSREFKYLKKSFTDLSNLKFNTYGWNQYNSPVKGNPEDPAGPYTQYPTNYVVFNYKNMAMWNYPLSASQIKQIKDRLLTGKSINDILTDYYEVNQYNEFTQTDKDTTDKANTTVVGRVFNIEREENTLNYTFDSENEEIYNQKLFKVQDFDYLDKLGGIHRLLIQNGRKSNLYSVRLKNTGLVPPENSGYELGTKDRQDYEAYYNECKNMLETAVKTICDKVEPVNVKLFKVMIDS